MIASRPPTPARARLGRIAVGLVPVLLAFGLGGTMAACGSTPATPGWSAPPAASAGGASPAAAAATDPHAGMGHLGPAPAAAVVETTWAARPAFVSGNGPDTEAAYRYALEHGHVIQWLPCYCGCVAMDHRSNLDCFLKPHDVAGPIAFEEHASFCDICVKTALLARDMLRDGKSMIEVRAAVDARFGDRAPGTVTPLPPG